MRGALLTIALGALLSACGSGGAVKTVTVQQQAAQHANTVARPTRDQQKADFIAQADRFCDEAYSEMSPIADRWDRIDRSSLPFYSRLPRYRAVFRDLGSAYEDLVGNLEGLHRPTGDAGRIGRFIRMLDSIPLQLDRLSASTYSLDVGLMGRAERHIYHTRIQAAGLADGYGFKVCARSRPGNVKPQAANPDVTQQ
jgi:hypothetical protein